MSTPPTLAEYVDGRLRDAILTGELLPGQKLRGEHLAAAWGVSPTPVREAFQRLAGEGMVTIEAQRGARVASIDPVEAAEFYDLRITLEPRALRAAIGRADDTYRADVLAAHVELTAGSADIGAHLAAHRRFHLALLAGCPNRKLHELCVQLHDHTQRFQVAGALYRRTGDAAAEHRALCDAAVAGDADSAVDILTAHLHATLAAVRSMG